MKNLVLTMFATALIFPGVAQELNAVEKERDFLPFEERVEEPSFRHKEEAQKRYAQLKKEFGKNQRSSARSITHRLDSILLNRFDVSQSAYFPERKSDFIYDLNGIHIETQEFVRSSGANNWVLQAVESASGSSVSNVMKWTRIELNGTVWDTTQKVIVDYDSQGNLIEYEKWQRASNNDPWNGWSKESYSVDMNGDITMFAKYFWDAVNTSWYGGRKYTYTYSQPNEVHFENYYQWDSNSWVHKTQNEYLYDSNGNIIQYENHIVQAGTGQLDKVYKWEKTFSSTGKETMTISYGPSPSSSQWEPLTRLDYFYNQLDMDSLYHYYRWNSSWALINKTEFSYNSANSLVDETHWGDDLGQWKEVQKKLYVYDSQNRLIEYMRKYRDHNWVLLNKDKITNNFGTGNEINTYYFWHNNQWWPNQKITKTINGQNQMVEMLTEIGSNTTFGHFIPSYRNTYGYDAAGNEISLDQEQYGQGGWSPLQWTERTFDINNVQFQLFFVAGPSNWYVAKQFEHYYDANVPRSDLQVPNNYTFEVMMTDSFIHGLQPGTPNKVNELHTEFFWSDLLSSTEDLETKKLEIYPNPTSGQFFIKGLPETKSELVLFDLNGKMLKTQLIQNDQSVDISMFPKGVYVYKVLTTGKPKVGKLIIH